MTLSVSARQQLRAPQVARAVRGSLAGHPHPAGRFLAVVAGPDDPLADAARAVEHEVSGTDHGAYDHRSRFLLVLDRDHGAVAGVIRTIAGPDTPTPHPPLPGGTLWEYTAPAVRPRYRGTRSALLVNTLLYRTLIVLCRAERVRHLVATVDRAAYRNSRLLGLPVTPFTQEGSQRYAVYGDATAFETSIAAQAARLRRSSRPYGAELRGVDNRTLAQRRVGADVARRLATGDGVDEHIHLDR